MSDQLVAYPAALIRNILQHEWSPGVVRRLLESGVVMVAGPSHAERSDDQRRAIEAVARRRRGRPPAEIIQAVLEEARSEQMDPGTAVALAHAALKEGRPRG